MKFDFEISEGWLWILGTILALKIIDLIWKMIGGDS